MIAYNTIGCTDIHTPFPNYETQSAKIERKDTKKEK